MTSTPPAQPILRNVDRPEIAETFADNIGGVNFDGSTVKIELKVARHDNQSSSAPPSIGLYTCARLVLTIPAMISLLNGLNQLQAAMQKQGVIKTLSASPDTVQ